ncbi:site-specific integrase, partial [Streptomyces sp. NPDC096176]|uniref:site-specific integrase n=1 Tax=Streptomyces sp. NPDC096176 TaxID=3366079 RepID=UPI0038211A88
GSSAAAPTASPRSSKPSSSYITRQPEVGKGSLTLEQAKAVLSAQKGTWVHAYVVVSLLVGIRTEEVRPLTWNRVHLAPPAGTAPHIEVWRSVRRREETKTRSSRRTLAVPRQLVAVLLVHRDNQQRRRETLGLTWNEDGYVFGTDSGEQRSAFTVRRSFRALLEAAGFTHPEEWTPRELRHSFVSLLSDHGIPLEVIARVVGHSGTQTTEAVYRKQLRPVITEGAEAMDAIFGESSTTEVQPHAGSYRPPHVGGSPHGFSTLAGNGGPRLRCGLDRLTPALARVSIKPGVVQLVRS